MSRIIKPNGFTLIELIIAMAVFGALSLVSVQMLWDTLSSRSKQYSIENSASAIRPIITTLSRAISEASYIVIPDATHIEITGNPNRTIRLNGTMLEESVDAGAYVSLTPQNISIGTVTIAPTGVQPKNISIFISGIYKDSLGAHTFQYTFSVSPRVAL